MCFHCLICYLWLNKILLWTDTSSLCVICTPPFFICSLHCLFEILRIVLPNLFQNLWLCYVAKMYAPKYLGVITTKKKLWSCMIAASFQRQHQQYSAAEGCKCFVKGSFPFPLGQINSPSFLFLFTSRILLHSQSADQY